MNVIARKLGGHDVGQRQTDGYFNATAMCQAAGKMWGHYWENSSTKEFMAELSATIGIPIVGLVESRVGRYGGTWVHPRVANHLAQWCSPRFAVLVSGWVDEILHTGRVEVIPAEPFHHPFGAYTARVVAASSTHSRVPNGYWTVFHESVRLLLVVEPALHAAGLTPDADDLLDGSVGVQWSKHRKDKPWAVETTTYQYTFPTGNRAGVTVRPRAYQWSEYPLFTNWLYAGYVREHLPQYLRNKYSESEVRRALPHLARHLPPALLPAG